MSDAPILNQTNHVTDIDSATDFERKHTPFIELETTDMGVKLSVTVGHYLEHPNQPDHYIGWIEVLAGESPIARFDLSPLATQPSVSVLVNLDPGTKVRAVQHCNLHGLWAAEAVV